MSVSLAVDGSFPPEQSARLAQALREAEVDHTIENYVGSAHEGGARPRCVPSCGCRTPLETFDDLVR